MNEIAYSNWQLAMAHLEAATNAEDINQAIVNTGIGELALKAAQFALANPFLVTGQDELPLPPGAVANPPVPQGPTQGPRLWGAPPA